MVVIYRLWCRGMMMRSRARAGVYVVALYGFSRESQTIGVSISVYLDRWDRPHKDFQSTFGHSIRTSCSTPFSPS